jgi:putative hydrolase
VDGRAASRSSPATAVDWRLAERAARDLARDGDRPASPSELARLEEALRLAEHWLDEGTLPAAPDAGRTYVLDRSGWIDLAMPVFVRLIGPIAVASTEALVTLAGRQLGELGRMLEEAPDALDAGLGDLPAIDLDTLDLRAFGIEGAQADAMREQLRSVLGEGADLGDLLRQALSAMGRSSGAGSGGIGGLGADPGEMLRPAAATLNALQAGQVIGRLAAQVHGHHDLGVPTAPGSTAGLVAVNVASTFAGYELDANEVAVLLAVTEAAHRRLHHAIGWLDDHQLHLLGRFADAMTVDESQLRELAEQMEQSFDPDDPAAFSRALERAGRLRLEPNAAQRAILAQLQVIVGLVGAWARHEAHRAVEGRLPNTARIAEVLRRRRATQGDGEGLLAGLLGLDLRPPDEQVAERFVAAVLDVLGTDGLKRALAHPENLPSPEELAHPGSWLERNVDGVVIPDDLSSLLDDSRDDPGDDPHDDDASDAPDHD